MPFSIDPLALPAQDDKKFLLLDIFKDWKLFIQSTGAGVKCLIPESFVNKFFFGNVLS